MERGALRLNWHRFFCSMTPQTEAALALCLADIGLSLGEYMEIMEESYIQTIAESGVRGGFVRGGWPLKKRELTSNPVAGQGGDRCQQVSQEGSAMNLPSYAEIDG
jgi:hypothetical protein